MDQQLFIFITVAEKENFTRASEVLHLTQSAVTLAIKSLEKKYDVKLLDRTNKYVRLTKAGEILYHHGKEIIHQYERVARLIDDLSSSATGSLVIGASFTFGEYILPKLIADFNQRYPDIEPDISISNSSRVIAQLLKGNLDIGIIEGDMEHENLVIEPFAEDEMVLIVSSEHPLSYKKEVELRELSEETWIIREEGSGTRQWIDKMFSENNYTPKKTRIFGSSQIIKESVEAGLGISMLSATIIQKEVALGTIKALKIQDYPIIRNFSYAITKSEFHPKTTDLFIEMLKEK